MAVHQHGRAQLLKQPVTNIQCVGDPCKVRKGEDEFIAAMAGKHVDVPNRCLQPVAGHFEADISQIMSQVVVDLLEAIQIDATNRNQLALSPGGDHRLTQAILQQGSIGQPGQEVVVESHGRPGHKAVDVRWPCDRDRRCCGWFRELRRPAAPGGCRTRSPCPSLLQNRNSGATPCIA